MKQKMFWHVSLWLMCNLPIALTSQSSLTVGDPRTTWSIQQGNIEDALLTVRNKCLYLEYGWYLSFSARGSSYKETDSLEVVFKFNLPEKSIVTDSWLWIGEDICKAKILDVWSASNIYENIVKRRRDPSLLTKTGTTEYTLRIFPMGGKETRRVKITYLVPVNWEEDKVSALLPAALLNASRYLPNHLPVLVWGHEDFQNPNVENTPTGPGESGVDSVQGPYQIFTVYPKGNFSQAMMSFTTPLKNGIHFCTFEDRNESYYQLAVKPSEFTELIRGEKTVVLLDYHFQDQSPGKASYMEMVKTALKTFLTPADSFAIIFSNLNYPPPIPGLRAGTDEQLDIAFWNGEEKLLSYTNLPQLLEKGIQFAQEQSTPVNILLISNSSQFGSNLVANDILRNVLAKNTKKLPIYVFDFCPAASNYLVNGRYYKNNEYLYLNLSQTTGGSFIREPLAQNFSNALANVLKLTLKQVNGFDLHLKVDQGIAYGKRVLMANPESFAAQDIYTQTGLFRGRFPITVELSGEINRQIFHAQFDLLQNESVSIDSSAKTVWFADALFKQEAQNPSNVVIQDIIYKSIENRILTKYTAFLCLEDSSYYCANCRDETGIPTANEEESQDSLTRLIAFPNPFHDRINIELHSGDLFNKQSAPARIMDLQGRIIRRFNVNHTFHDGITQYIWDGKDDSGLHVPSGAYVLEVRIGDKMLYKKLIRF